LPPSRRGRRTRTCGDTGPAARGHHGRGPARHRPLGERDPQPHIWHFAFHAIPALPERLVQGRQAEYFRFFYDALSFDRAKILPADRSAYVDAYAADAALTAGFNWYRTFPRDAEENRGASAGDGATPLLYLRGARETGEMREYVDGLRAAGVGAIQHGVVPEAGHFAHEEAPEATWRLLDELGTR
jgi:pimeloyl-ACP methyl ester carboxylesterase